MSAVELRLVDLKSLEECRKLVEFVNTHYRSRLPVELNAVQSGRTTFFWAYADGALVGATGFVTKTAFLAETVKTVVHAEHRGRGLGAAISQAIEQEVRRHGFKKVMSTILIDNLPMIFIKLKQGYRFEGFHPDHEAPGLHEYSLGKIL